MKNFFIVFFLIPLFSIAQKINTVDEYGKRQGLWLKKYEHGSIRYKGIFQDDKPKGLFYYYYETEELRAKKQYLKPNVKNRIKMQKAVYSAARLREME